MSRYLGCVTEAPGSRGETAASAAVAEHAVAKLQPVIKSTHKSEFIFIAAIDEALEAQGVRGKRRRTSATFGLDPEMNLY